MKKTLPVISALLLIILFMAMMPAAKDPTMKFHSPEEIALFMTKNLPTLDSGQYFHHPEACRGCHGSDTMGLANVDGNGTDINLYDDWETSMMGLSAVDPFWRAQVSYEILTNPAHSNELQTLCTSCHAPMGHYTSKYLNQTHYTISDLINDSLGLAGVGCMGCHSIGTDSLGLLFTGRIPYDTNHVAYGPFDNPMTGPMQLYVGLTPMQSDHVSEGRMCSSCHTLVSNSVDLNGIPTGSTFVEQATYHEWLNSDYPAQETTCQSCHMPQITDPVKIANGYLALPGRTPFNLHSFAGANAFMVNLIKTNKTSLGISSPDANFDSTLSAINRLLTQNTLTIECVNDSITSDTAYISVKLINKAGHKFPSGYPSRRAVLQLLVQNATDTLFASGLFDSTGEVMNIDPVFEMHHNVINDEQQSQIYEMVMGDVNGDKTTLLERAYAPLKDNRIPPEGFSTSHSNYDTCAIVGDATTDADFNYSGLTEGTGSDIVHYHIPLNGYTGQILITASVHYQAVPPAFLTDMFTHQSPEIDSFEVYYSGADKTPVFMGSDTMQLSIPVSIAENELNKINVYPTVTSDGKIIVEGRALADCEMKLFDQTGKATWILKAQSSRQEVNLPSRAGFYYLQLTKGSISTVKKLTKL